MSTSVAEREKLSTRTINNRRSQAPQERFKEETEYAAFGSIVGTRMYAAPGMLSSIASWMASHSSSFNLTHESFARLWKTCAERNPSWFLTATAIRLREQSRSFAPGIHIFHAIKGFSQIPDNSAPRTVHDAYTAAIGDHPSREFMYLEPLWRNIDGVLTPTTAAEFKGLLEGQRAEILKMIPRIRVRRVFEGCMNATGMLVGVLLSIVLAIVFFALQVVPGISWMIRRLAETKELMALEKVNLYGGRRIEPIGLWEAARTLATPISTRKLEKLVYRWDPVIVFIVPELAHHFDGEVPLGLVIHWD